MDEIQNLLERISKLPPNIKWRAEEHYREATKLNSGTSVNWLNHMIKLIKMLNEHGV